MTTRGWPIRLQWTDVTWITRLGKAVRRHRETMCGLMASTATSSAIAVVACASSANTRTQLSRHFEVRQDRRLRAAPREPGNAKLY